MELRQFYSEEPFGHERDNLHAAVICRTIANKGIGKHRKGVGIEPFMIKPAEEVRQNKLAQGIQWLMSKAKRKAT